MDEAKLYEAIGRKQMAIEFKDAAYAQLLDALQQVVSGQLAPEKIEVDTANQRWRVIDDPR